MYFTVMSYNTGYKHSTPQIKASFEAAYKCLALFSTIGREVKELFKKSLVLDDEKASKALPRISRRKIH